MVNCAHNSRYDFYDCTVNIFLFSDFSHNYIHLGVIFNQVIFLGGDTVQVCQLNIKRIRINQPYVNDIAGLGAGGIKKNSTSVMKVAIE